MEQVKRIPYGMSDFVKVIEQNNYYVDKTMYLPMLEDEPNNLFFIRPRRFGKSIFLSMFETFGYPARHFLFSLRRRFSSSRSDSLSWFESNFFIDLRILKLHSKLLKINEVCKFLKNYFVA